MKNKRNLSPREVIQIVFANFEKGRGSVMEKCPLEITLSEASCSPGFYYWKGFKGNTKYVVRAGEVYALWLGETNTRESHHSPFSLWYQKIGKEETPKEILEKKELARYLIKRGIDEGSQNCFTCVRKDNFGTFYKKPAYRDFLMLARGYPLPERNEDRRIVDRDSIWYKTGKRNFEFPIEKIPEDFIRQIVKARYPKQKWVERFGSFEDAEVYSPDVLNYVTQEIVSS